MWIKLKSIQNITENGKPVRYYPGDWVDVGKQYALRLVAQGLAEKPGVSLTAEMVDYTAGMLIIGELETNAKQQIIETIPHLEMAYGSTPDIPFSETLIYDTKLKPLRVELLHVGFKWLEKFQLLIPMHDYAELAVHIGTEQDREITKSIIRELRVPVYDTRLIFVRRCDETKELFIKWQEYKTKISEDKLAFLCALYEIKPVMMPLPTTWISKDRVR